MHIGNSYSSTLFPYHRNMQAATNESAAGATGQSARQEPSVAGSAETPAVKGSAFATYLSPETVQYMINQQIKAGETPSTPEELQQRHAELRREHFDRIATDPDYAAKEAKLLASSHDGLLIPNDVFDAYVREGRTDALGYALNDPNNPVLQVHKQRMALYDQKVAEGVPPAQIFKELLEFNLDLPDSYTDGELDLTGSYPPGYYKSQQQGDLDLLNEALSKA